MRKTLLALLALAIAAPAAAQQPVTVVNAPTVEQGTPAATSDAAAWPFKIVFGSAQIDPRDISDRVARALGMITFDGTQPVSVASLPLPTGAATSANQTNGLQQTKIVDPTNPLNFVNVKSANVGATTADKALVVAISPNNSVTVNQGQPVAVAFSWPVTISDGTNTMPTMDAVGRSGFVKLTDGTNPVTIKGSFFPATTADTSLVVALSPNTGLPTGSNVVGSIANTAFTANAGTNLNTSALALDATLTGGTQQTKITDGTNVATVKAASTAAAAADKAIVVAISPNNVAAVSLAANQSVNLTQIAGAAVSTGLGVGDSGTQRTTVAAEFTYAAATNTMTATAAGTGPFFNVCGSASKTIRVQRIRISGTVATGAKYGDVTIKKTTAATTAGTATTLTAVAYDTGNATSATGTAKFYTVLGTAGTGATAIDSSILFLPITGTPAATGTPIEFVWRDNDSEAPTLRGTAQCLEMNFGTTTATAPTLSVAVKWTEK